MNRKEELERLHQQSLEMNGRGTPQRSLQDGAPPLSQNSNEQRHTNWVLIILLLVAAGVGAWFAYKPLMSLLGIK